MRRIPTYALYPGLKVARAVRNSFGQVLLGEGTILTRRFIKRLTNMGVPALYIEDGLLPDIEVEDIINEETRNKAVGLVKNLIGEENRDAASLIKKTTIMSKEITNTVTEIIEELISNRNAIVNMVDIRSYDEYTFAHSVNVCVLSILTGIALGYNQQMLSRIGIGTLMHDVGKILIPKEILGKPGSLTEEEYGEVKKHCFFGSQIVKYSDICDIVAASVSLQHHERYDGQGYPNGLKGKNIHEFSRIAGVVDTYDAITADRVYRKAFPAHVAFEFIAGAGGTLFDSDIIKAFLTHIAAYPVGTIVLLNTKEVGAVVENIKGCSNQPRVRILFEPNGKYVSSYQELWLAEKNDVCIVGVIDDMRQIKAIQNNAKTL